MQIVCVCKVKNKALEASKLKARIFCHNTWEVPSLRGHNPGDSICYRWYVFSWISTWSSCISTCWSSTWRFCSRPAKVERLWNWLWQLQWLPGNTRMFCDLRLFWLHEMNVRHWLVLVFHSHWRSLIQIYVLGDICFSFASKCCFYPYIWKCTSCSIDR